MDKVTPSELVMGVYEDDYTDLVEGFIVIGESLYVWNTNGDRVNIDEWVVGIDGLMEVEYDTFIITRPVCVHHVSDLIAFLKERM